MQDANAPKTRALFIINSLAGGGAERVMSTLLTLSGSERDQFEISLALLDIEDASYAVPEWIGEHQLDSRRSLLRSIVLLSSLFRRVRPDIGISFLTRANVATVLASAACRVPCIISERVNTSSHLGNGLGSWVAKRLVRWTYPRAKRIIAVSPGVAEDLRESFAVPKSKIVVVANPVDLAAIERQSREDPVLDLDDPFIVGMGRLVENKNFGLLIDAFALSGVGGKLVILGEGPEREILSRKISELGLADRVLMPGFLQNPFAVLRRAKLFVLPSNAEGFPNGLLEAMALGVPVISTNCCSGPSEILAARSRDEIDGPYFAEYGVLVPTESPELMADALRAMEDRDLRGKYGEVATARARMFGAELAKSQYWEIIKAEIKGARPAPRVRLSTPA